MWTHFGDQHCETNSIGKDDDIQQQLNNFNENKTTESLLKSNNRRKQNKPNRLTNDDEGGLIIDEAQDLSTTESLISTDDKVDHPLPLFPPPPVPSTTPSTEAYCHLCERSFCNKYFLKTHLSKKHGIFNMISPLSSADPNDNNLPIPLSPSVEQQQQPLPLLVNPKPVEKFSEDYCEICQKRFCNKYYLRKHKGECHGIYTDYIKSLQKSTNENPLKSSTHRRSSSSISSQVKRQDSSNSNDLVLPSNTLLLNPFYPGPSDLKSLYPINASSTPSLVNESSKSSSPQRSKRRCHLCEQQFRTKSLLRNHMITVHQTDKSHSPSPLLATTNLSFLQPFLDSSSQLAQKVITSQASPTPYGLGPDPYFCAKMADRVVCEICNKQVCNKYFLKTHKAKVHGITSTDSSETSNSENSDTYCALCKKDFTTKYFYLFHMQAIHQDTSDPTYQTFLEFLKTASATKPMESFEIQNNSEEDDDENEQDQSDSNDPKYSRKRTLSQSSSSTSTTKRFHSPMELSHGGLQPFLLESEDPNFSQTFVPCMVYLPVLRRVTQEVKIHLRLKPVLTDNSA